MMPGAETEIMAWSRSLEIFLRRAPQTEVLISIVSGVLAKKWVRHPLTRLRRERRDRQRLAEMLQVVIQLFKEQALEIKPYVTFGETLSFHESISLAEVLASAKEYSHQIRNSIVETANRLLAIHMAQAGA